MSGVILLSQHHILFLSLRLSFIIGSSNLRIHIMKGTLIEGNADYYLSDTADTEFVASKMGHAQGSRYIVRRDHGNRSWWLEIVTITPEHLTLRSSSNVLLEFSAQPKQGGNSPE